MTDTAETTTTSTLTYSRYPAYKDSGVDWLGEIPAHWEVRKLKHLFKEKKHATNQFLNCGSISFGKVVIKDDEKVPDSTKASYQEVLSGEFLINPLNLNYDLISLRIALSYIDVVVSPGYIVLRDIVELNREYFKFLLHRYDVAYMKLLGSGVRQTISFNHIANSLLILFPLAEQTRIAEFLDRKTAQIDQAIAQKERLIELLNERRQVMIHRAVTRGLNPDTPMKDSDIEWIGEIPAHWEVKKLKHLTSKIGSGITPSGGATGYLEMGIPLLRSQNILWDKIDFEGVAFISEGTHKSMSNSHVKHGDVLLNITGGSIGRCHYVETEAPMNVNQHVCIIRPTDEISTVFLNSLLSSKVGQGQIWYHQQGGGREGLNFQAIKNFELPIPSRKEQHEIIEHLNTIIREFGSVIEKQYSGIQKLQELKSTLINSAVTGKIKV